MEPNRIAILAGCVVLYFLPTGVMLVRRSKSPGEALCLAAVNLLCGWTGLGWMAVVGWALIDDVFAGTSLAGPLGQRRRATAAQWEVLGARRRVALNRKSEAPPADRLADPGSVYRRPSVRRQTFRPLALPERTSTAAERARVNRQG